ncbi:amino acid adenylation domain-containing protein [Amycolatopsis sp. NPDC004079]|uniref:amino acid adenylation domain-containing protein n=1 Tax=Amycolatopsis sp. NPDC004079 TaxID=3154549 RepID=UPI0033B182B5
MDQAPEENLVDVLRARAASHADKPAYTFLADGETDAASSVTFGELDRKARAVAARLSRDVRAGDRVLLVHPAGLDFVESFFGTLYAGAVPVPCPSHEGASPERVLSRIRGIVEDCRPVAVVSVARFGEQLIRHAPALKNLPFLGSDRVSPDDSGDWHAPAIRPDSLAFLQYTSGSTGNPKGVMVEHRNLTENLRMIDSSMRQRADSVLVSWLPLFHDMGLIGILHYGAYLGAHSVLMSPGRFLRNPVSWLSAMSRFRGTMTGAPNFAYELCLRKIGAAERARLDLSSAEVMFNGAEPVRADTLDRFAETFAECGLRREALKPCYGLAEATLIVSAGAHDRPHRAPRFDTGALEAGHAVPDEHGRELASCGVAAGEQRVEIVDPVSRRILGPGETGEIWVAGNHVARGYWNRARESLETFRAATEPADGRHYLRTGDLGFRIGEELYLFGRRKDVLIVRGRNLAPQDVERCVENAHSGLRPGCGAVFQTSQDEGEPKVVAVQEFDPAAGGDPAAAIEAIRSAVTRSFEIELDAVSLVAPRTIPKTSSGKIQRRGSLRAFSGGLLDEIARWERPADGAELADRIEWHLRELTCADPDAASLPALGVDSLRAAEIGGQLEREFGRPVSAADLLGGVEIPELARKIAATLERPRETVPAGSAREFPLSDNQIALWFLQERQPASSAYTIATALRIPAGLDVAAFRRSWDVLVQRHEALRTRFGQRDGTPYQEVLADRRAEVTMVPAAGWSAERLRAAVTEEAERPFDLTADPLLRIGVYDRGPDGHCVLIAVHHIVSDFWSLARLFRELAERYRAETGGAPIDWAPVRGRYAEFVREQSTWLAGPQGARQLSGCAAGLDPLPAPLELPTDRTRPPEQTERGMAVSAELPGPLCARVTALARERGVTRYTLLLTVFQVLLHRYTGQEDFVVGCPAAGREPKFADVVGYFVNPLAIRAGLSGDPRFSEVLAGTRDAVLSAMDRQRVPFVRVVERLAPERDASRGPLFQVMFVSQRSPVTDPGLAGLARFALGDGTGNLELGGLAVESFALERCPSQSDLVLMAAECADEVGLSLRYNVDLFDEATARRLLRHYQVLLEEVVADPERRLSELPLLTAAERRQFAAWHDTGRDHSGYGWIPEEFAARAAEHPDAIAVRYQDIEVAYRDLEKRANQLARHLLERGAGRGALVGVALERGVDLVVALLATMKAGAAYLPLDLENPRRRLAAMLGDAAPAVVLTASRWAGLLPESAAQVVDLDACRPEIAAYDDAPPDVAIEAGDAAYVLYTSGSTGTPKAVVNTHAGIRNRLAWTQNAFGLTADDRVLQKTPIGFDVSVWEFFWPLTTGAGLVLAEPGAHRDTGRLVSLIDRHRVTTVHFVPSMLQLFLSEPNLTRCASLRRVIASGETLPAGLARRFFQTLGCELHNLYGPTEAAVDVAAWRCRPDDPRDFVPIGHAIDNVRLHLLDGHGREVPVGVPGELHIGGVQVAAGYLNRPELTRERFLPDPFGPDPDGRLYRTGDLARRHPDGSLEFLGRLDRQLKFRGNRIELEEIERKIAAHPAVRDAAVLVRGSGEEAELIGYLAGLAAALPEPGGLREFLALELPRYMIPHRFVTLAELPLTANGKVDRKALPLPEKPARSATAISPRTPEERSLAAVIGQVLGHDEIGVRDNFFELGGDSIRALQVRVLARQRGLDFTIPELFRAQTVETLAATARTVEPATGPRSVRPFALLAAEDRAALPEGVEDAFPLARLQAGLVFHSEMSPDYETYVMGFRLRGRFARRAMTEALRRLAARHPMLRTSFALTGFSEPLQLVHAKAEIPLTVHEISGSAAEQDAEIDRFMRERKWRKPEWAVAPLLEIDVHLRSAEEFQCTFAHPLFDGWSMALLVTELFEAYAALAAGTPPPRLPPIRQTYADFVALERETVDSAAERKFWAAYLAGDSRGDLPRWPSRRHSGPAAAHRRTEVAIEDEVRDGLLELARQTGTSLKSVLLAAHLRVVSVLACRRAVTAGIIANGRPEELDGDRVAGLFLNTVPLRMRFDGGTWRELVRQTHEAERELLDHRRFPLAELVREFGAGEQLFDTAFNYIHFHVYQALRELDGLEVLGWKSPSDQTYFPFTAYFHRDVSTSKLLCYLDVDEGTFDPAQVDLVVGYYRTVLAAMAAEPDARYEARSLLGPAELIRQREDWNETATPWPLTMPRGVHRRFAAQARRCPDAVAVRCGDEALTYAELERRANCLAHRLHRLGVRPGDTVGIALGRDVALPVALLGVLKAGGAYVPIDPGYPRERLRQMLDDSGAAVVVTESSVLTGIPETAAAPLVLDRAPEPLAAEPDTCPEIPFDPDRLAYVIYTSGSTGVPKGVEVSHRALDNLLHAMAELLGWDDRDVLLAVTTLSFDIAGLELFLPLTTGARLELATAPQTGDPYRLAELLVDRGVTTMQATPATWRMLVDSGWAAKPDLRALCGGEALTAELAEAVRKRCDVLWNLYGPTECTIWSTAARIEEVDGPPPIGRPLANTTCWVLDEHGQCTPAGTPGELHLGGLGLARGYRNRPELTERAFRPHPHAPGERLYRTGDLARWRPDGTLEFLGRLDDQVKVRGFRIEPGEIETVLGRRAELSTAVVAARNSGEGGARLVAYVVGRPGAEVDTDALRGELTEALPSYMVPDVVVELDALPMTPNGKVDRNALPAPAARRRKGTEGTAGPRTGAERMLAEIWGVSLKLDALGIDEPFFEAGGHSLLMIRVHAQIRERWGEVPLSALFEYPTIRGLAAFLERGFRPDGGLDDARGKAERRRAAGGRARARRGVPDGSQERR